MSVVVARRLDDALRCALGNDVARILDEPDLTDLMLNADGKLWADRLGVGRRDTGVVMKRSDAETALRLLADHCGVPLTKKSPILSATLPRTGERIAAAVSPVSASPVFAIRKPPSSVFSLNAFRGDAGSDGRQEDAASPTGEDAFSRLLGAVESCKNILVAGSTGSGKTSLVSSLLQLPSVQKRRMVVIEDTQELAISSDDQVRFLTSPDVDMRQLVQLALRFRPDSIVLGEVRSGAAALEMIHAANTGHVGGFSTIHANSAEDALGRLEDLCSEVCVTPPTRAIRTAIGCVVFVERTPTGRRIKEVLLP